MKNFTLLLLILIVGCKGNDYNDKQLSYRKIDTNGGTNFLDIQIDDKGKVNGTSGYVISEQINGFREITGVLKDNEIVGSAYNENSDESMNLKIKLSDNSAEYIEYGREAIILALSTKPDNEKDSKSSSKKHENSFSCENTEVLNQLTEMLKENGIRGAKVIKGYTIRKDEKTSNCDCEARLEGEYWVKDGSAPLDRHSINEPKIRYTLYKNYEGETMIEITNSEI